MGNGKVQTKRVSRIHKGIRRTLKTAEYESVVIESLIEEDIEWSSLEERQRKIKNWEALVIQDFKEYHDIAMRELGCEYKCAFPKNAVAKKIKPKAGQKTELDDLIKEIDNFDTVTD